MTNRILEVSIHSLEKKYIWHLAYVIAISAEHFAHNPFANSMTMQKAKNVNHITDSESISKVCVDEKPNTCCIQQTIKLIFNRMFYYFEKLNLNLPDSNLTVNYIGWNLYSWVVCALVVFSNFLHNLSAKIEIMARWCLTVAMGFILICIHWVSQGRIVRWKHFILLSTHRSIRTCSG